jgi:hypothetical protein
VNGTAPGLSVATVRESCRYRRGLPVRTIASLGLGWRNISDGFELSAVVEPIDPFEGGVFDGLAARCGPLAAQALEWRRTVAEAFAPRSWT